MFQSKYQTKVQHFILLKDLYSQPQNSMIKTQNLKDQLQKFILQQENYQQVQNYLLPQEQSYFAEELFQITQRFIPTSYGQIYSITAGSPGQPLILIVHGSGPKNSCAQYQYLLQQYLVRISYIEKFYIVAIDCPGYGKSIGSKQAVKTFPKQMFQQILQGLNYKSYFAMYGHSQGGAAIFNAIYQNTSLAQILIMDRPVCGNIQRFRKFNVPTLLVYDIEDDGHPIWQGKLLYKQLSYSELYTYKASQDTYWVPDNIWTKMLQFFAKYANNRKGRRNIFSNIRPVSMSPQIKQSRFKQPSNNKALINQKKNEQKEQISNKKIKEYKKQKSLSQSLSKQNKPHSLDTRYQLKKKREKYTKTNFKIELQQVEQLEREKQELLSIYSSSLSEEQKTELHKIQEQMKLKEQELLKDNNLFKRSEHKNVELNKNIKAFQISEEVVIQKKQINTKNQQINSTNKGQLKVKQSQNPKNLNEEQDKYRCAICYDTYYRPIETNCNHIFCTKCLLEALLVDTRCPLCRGNVSKKTEKKQLHQQVISLMNKSQIEKREKAYLKLKLMLDSIVLIQIGNRSIEVQTKKSHFSKTKKKFNWELFVNQKTNFKFQQVSFDVNMGNPQSKPVKFKNAPFAFQSRGTFSFSCQITIKPRNKEYAPLIAVYRINLQPGVHKKVIAFKRKVYLKQ